MADREPEHDAPPDDPIEVRHERMYRLNVDLVRRVDEQAEEIDRLRVRLDAAETAAEVLERMIAAFTAHERARIDAEVLGNVSADGGIALRAAARKAALDVVLARSDGESALAVWRSLQDTP